MSSLFSCSDQNRRNIIAGRTDVNGIDFLDISEEIVADQVTYTYTLHFINPEGVDQTNFSQPETIQVEGGSSISGIRVTSLTVSGQTIEIAFNKEGDFSDYILKLNVANPVGVTFDPILSSVSFRFPTDCPEVGECDPQISQSVGLDTSAPSIDYLTRDYEGFRQLILDRLSTSMQMPPDTSPADITVALTEAIAFKLDQISYFQDSVATEAYLSTARRRISVRRHARLLDYPMHEGCNARTWVRIQVKQNVAGLEVPMGARFLTRSPAGTLRLSEREYQNALASGSLQFEAMEATPLSYDANSYEIYTWFNDECVLCQGAINADLRKDGISTPPQVGMLLAFQEVIDPVSGEQINADPEIRHVVRITSVTAMVDPLIEVGPNGDSATDNTVYRVGWAMEDALPFDLVVSAVVEGRLVENISMAFGNIVPVDHGQQVQNLTLSPATVQGSGEYWPRLETPDLTFREPTFDSSKPAASFQMQDPGLAMPDIVLDSDIDGKGQEVWNPVRDLLSAGPFAKLFVVEMENERTARLRFGDNDYGAKPVAGSNFFADVRLGNGTIGNIGADALVHIYDPAAEPWSQEAAALTNPLPAKGGQDPQSLTDVRRFAPFAFREQQRAVTALDYQSITERHPEVQRAYAEVHSSGSWSTAFISVDRVRGLPVDRAFEVELTRYLEPLRLMGQDVEFAPPVLVPLDIELQVCVNPGYDQDVVRRELEQAFSANPNASPRGFFHPDSWTFAQTLWLSSLISTANDIQGVKWVQPATFRRLQPGAQSRIAEGFIAADKSEILVANNDPSHPDRGRIRFSLLGGLA